MSEASLPVILSVNREDAGECVYVRITFAESNQGGDLVVEQSRFR